MLILNSLIRILPVIVIMLSSVMSFSQDSGLGNWLVYIGSKKIDTRWNIHHEVQYRNYNAIGDLEQLLLRGGVGYNLTEGNNNLLLGYGYIHSENYVNADDKVNVGEHRLFQQFITKQKAGSIGLQHRYRIEERWVEGDFKLRFRYFLGLKFPLKQSPYYLSVYNEIFINNKDNVFDRNRTYGGIGYKLSDALRLELGYMNQFLNAGSRDQINLIVFSSF